MAAPNRLPLAAGIVLAALTVSVTAASAQHPTLWRETLSSRVVTFGPTPFGSVLVQLTSGLFALDPETGKHLWSRADVTGSPIDVVPGTTVAFVRTARGRVVLDLESGQDRWKPTTLGFSHIKGGVDLPSRGLVLVYGVTAESSHTLMAVRYETGEVLWKQTTLFAGPDLAPKARRVNYTAYALDTDDTVVLAPTEDGGFMEGRPSRAGLIRLDLGSGQVLWRIPENALHSGRADWEPPGVTMFADDGRIFQSYERTLLAVSTGEGKVLWTRKEKFPSPISQLVSTPHGLLVRGATVGPDDKISGGAYLTLLDPATGATKWTTEKTKFEGRSSFLIEDDTIMIALKKGVATYDLSSGRLLTTVRWPEFDGTEDPCCLERFDDGRLLVWSSQNLRMLDSSDTLLYSRYFKAPGASFMTKLAAATVAEVFARISHSYVENPAVTAKYRATVHAGRFAYVFTESPGQGPTKFALVRVDKSTGQESGRVWLADRTSKYLLEPVTGVAVVLEDNSLSAVRFP